MRSVVRSSLPPEIKRSLDACWKEGVAAQVVAVIFDYFLVPYGLLLGATPQQIGYLVASPSFLSAVAQLFAVRAVYTAGTRHKLLVRSTAFQAFMLLPLAFLPLVPMPGKLPVLIGLASFFRVVGSLIGPAWGSLVSDYLPEGQRGQYMGWRSRVVSLAGVATLAFWGPVLLLTRKASPTLGFVLLFGAAAAFRFLSLRYMSLMADIPVSHPPEREVPSPWKLLRRFHDHNLVKFIFYVSGVTFATQLAAPSFSVYMLQDLRFNYASYTAVHLASVIGGLAAFPVWGRHMDAVGTARIMKSVSLLVPISPLFWLFARGPASLAAVEFLSGFVWSGFTLASATFLYDAVSPALRVRWLSYFNLINGAAVFLGAALGGWLSSRLPPLFGGRLLTLFFISALLRLAAHFILSERFEEARTSVRLVSASTLFLSVLGLKPMAGESTEPAFYPPLRPSRGEKT